MHFKYLTGQTVTEWVGKDKWQVKKGMCFQVSIIVIIVSYLCTAK